ncbi:MAG: Lrp/AsnC family transcriptional regulator [Elusimicrobia bacterium]|nr:Lrp/AsnC family transcriptional regulator [Elusimicrobiota bacterium]
MDELDRKILMRVQEALPLVPTPFAEIGVPLGLTESDTITRLQRLKKLRIVRQISAIFDTRALGYQSTLVAMRAVPERLDQAAKVVNRHPGVSHNYARNHAYNLWFTLAIPPLCSLEQSVERLRRLSGAESARILPTLRLFKIGVQLDVEGTEPASARSATVTYDDAKRKAIQAQPVTDREIAFIRVLQEDFPLVSRPFQTLAESLGCSEAEVLEQARRFQEQGRMRRYAAILFHRRAGFTENAMGVWVVPGDRMEEVGRTMASFKKVSHCYQRPVYPDWPYSIFTMVHGRTVEECQAVIDAIAQATELTEYCLLYSTREYKKIRLKYFDERLDQWEADAAQ